MTVRYLPSSITKQGSGITEIFHKYINRCLHGTCSNSRSDDAEEESTGLRSCLTKHQKKIKPPLNTNCPRWNSTETIISSSNGLFLWLGDGTTNQHVAETDSFIANKKRLLLPIKQATCATIEDPESIAALVNNHYENVDAANYIGGMGENDPGVWFATAKQSTIKDTLDYAALIQEGIALVKEERHGVPFGIYTTGLYTTLDIPLPDIGIDVLNVTLFAGSPDQYKLASGISDDNEARTAFGKVCSIIADATEQGMAVQVGVLQSQAASARDLAYSLGAVEVHVFPDR